MRSVRTFIVDLIAETSPSHVIFFFFFLMHPNRVSRVSSQLWCLWSESCCWSLAPHGQTSHLEDVAPQEAMLHTSASGLNRAVSTNRSLVCIETNKEKSLTPAAFIVKWFFLFLYKKGGGCSPQGDSQNKLVCKIDKIYKKLRREHRMS